MADVLKRLYGPAQPTTAVTTIYTVPAATTTVLRYIRFVNTAGADRAVTMSVGADSTATRIFSAVTIGASGGSLDWTGAIPLTAGEVLQCSVSGNASINVVVVGVEVS